MRRSLLLLTLGAGLTACSNDDPEGAPSRAPGLWFVSIDTLRWDALGHVDEQGRADSPELDALFEAGWSTTRARSHVPLTLPSHGTMMTGLLPPRLGVHDNAPFRIADGIPTLAERLRDAGWSCGAVLGGAPLARGCGLERGFDRYVDPPPTRYGASSFGERRADEVSDATLELLADADEGPTFLWSHYFDPHAPYTPPPRLSPGSSPRERYRGEVRFVDQQIGRVLRELRATSRRWWVVITSDHGEGLGEGGERTHGYQVFDSTLRVPLAVVEIEGERSGVPAGLRGLARGRSAELVDLCPTLLSLCGLGAPPDADGRDLGTDPPPRPAYLESFAAALQFGWAQTSGVRDEEGWLLWTGELQMPAGHALRAVPTGLEGEVRLRPVDAALDPVDALREALVGYRETEGSPGDPLLGNLRALGYLEGSEDPGAHLLRPREENARLPSAVSRVRQIERILAAIALVQEGDEGGLRAIQELAREDPGNASLAFYEGRAQLARSGGQPVAARAAVACFRRALQLDPGFPGARLLEAQALGLAGQYDEALQIARGVVRDDPEQASAHQLLGSLLLEAGTPSAKNPHHSLEQGFEHLVRAVELGGDPRLRARVVSELATPSAAPAPWRAELLDRLRSASND